MVGGEAASHCLGTCLGSLSTICEAVERRQVTSSFTCHPRRAQCIVTTWTADKSCRCRQAVGPLSSANKDRPAVLQRAVRHWDPETARASFQSPSRSPIAGNNSAGAARLSRRAQQRPGRGSMLPPPATVLPCWLYYTSALWRRWREAREEALADGANPVGRAWHLLFLGALIVDGFQPAGSGDAFRGPLFPLFPLFPTLRPPASRGMIWDGMGRAWDGMDRHDMGESGQRTACRLHTPRPALSHLPRFRPARQSNHDRAWAV
jgi:hypothetical protein